MLATILLAIILLAVAVALMAVKNLCGKGTFRPGHACKFNARESARKSPKAPRN